jgi:hypothetical protein
MATWVAVNDSALPELFYACEEFGSMLEFLGVLRLWMKLSTNGKPWFSTDSRVGFRFFK